MVESFEAKEIDQDVAEKITMIGEKMDEVDAMMNSEDVETRIKGGNVRKSFELLSQAADIISELPDGSEKDQQTKRIGDLMEATKMRMNQWLLKKSLNIKK